MGLKRRRALKQPGSGNTARLRTEPWHAVEIRYDADCVCAAAKTTAGRRFLATEAPLLPLTDCDRRDQCQCRYRHFPDRRKGPRRRVEGAPPNEKVTGTEERRCTQSRREEDQIGEEEVVEATASPLEDTYYDYVSKNSIE